MSTLQVPGSTQRFVDHMVEAVALLKLTERQRKLVTAAIRATIPYANSVTGQTVRLP